MEINGYDTRKNYSNEELDLLMAKSPYHKATSNDVDWISKVKMQGKIQKWVDHSISVTINLPEECSSRIIDMVTKRKGEMRMMESKNDRIHLQFIIPSRGIIGLNNAVLTASAGEAIMAHRFIEFQPWKGDIERRANGAIIAMEAGTAFAYALNNLQSRGRFFVSPQEDVYAGQIVGEHSKEGDLVVNVTKSKKLTNMRASGSDDKVSLAPPVVFSLEDALEYIKADEYVEVTPNSMRLRKIVLDENERKRLSR